MGNHRKNAGTKITENIDLGPQRIEMGKPGKIK